MALTKKDIKERLREGSGAVDYVDAPELGGELAVRPLTQGEIDKVNTKAVQGQTFTGELPSGDDQPDNVKADGLTLDVASSAAAQAEAKAMTVAFGLSVDERWSPNDAKELPPGLFRRVLAKVEEICDDDAFIEDAETFRGDAPGRADGDARGDGDTAG